MDIGRRLYLLRHAKSSWDDPHLRDDERPLAPRGRKAADAMRQHLASSAIGVDVVLCSPAQRTRETWAAVSDGLKGDPDVKYVPGVYEATSGELLALIRAVAPETRGLLVVGHNPGFEGLTTRLSGGGDNNAMARLRAKFPTGAFATLDISVPWADLNWGDAYLTNLVFPRDLPGT